MALFDAQPTPPAPAGDPQPPTPAMLWVMRIGMTLFLIPFFTVGWGMLTGGSFFPGGPDFGAPTGFRLFGLPFVAVPAVMLIAVWSMSPRSPHQPARRDDAFPEPPPAPPVAPPTVRVPCAYCGGPRDPADTRCSSCGGH